MSSLKIGFAICLLAFCFVLGSDALRCLSCSGLSSCKSPKKYECNQGLANDTRSYLNFHYKGIDMNTMTNSFICFADSLEDSTGEYEYKGCLFADIVPCTLALNEFHNQFSYSRCCNQCDRDYCNPAGRASMSLLTLAGAVTLAAIGKRAFAF